MGLQQAVSGVFCLIRRRMRRVHKSCDCMSCKFPYTIVQFHMLTEGAKVQETLTIFTNCYMHFT